MPFKPWEEVLESFIILVAQFGAIEPDLSPGLRSCKSNCMKSETRAWGKDTTPTACPPHWSDPQRGRPANTLGRPLPVCFCSPPQGHAWFHHLCLPCLMMATLIWARNLTSEWSFADYFSHVRKFWNPQQNRERYNEDFSFGPIKVVEKNSVPNSELPTLRITELPQQQVTERVH